MYWYNEGIIIEHEDRELENVRVLWHGQVGKSGDQLPHWRLEWSQVEAESSYPDDGLTLPTHGDFTSPNYPENYPNGLHLQKAIIVDEGYVVSISVKDFSMDHSSNHCTDYLEIKDGDGTLLG